MLKKRKRLASFRLPEWLLFNLKGLDNRQSQAENIEHALIKVHRWEQPNDENDGY